MTEILKSISVQFGTCKVSYKEPTEHEMENYPASANRPYSVEALSFGESFSREELVQWQKDINAAINIVLSKTVPEPSALGTAIVVDTGLTPAGRVYPPPYPPPDQFPPTTYPGDPRIFTQISPIFRNFVPGSNVDDTKDISDA